MLSKTKLTQKSLINTAILMAAILFTPISIIAKPKSEKSIQKSSGAEFTIFEKNKANLSLWYRIKHALEYAFNTQKKLKDIIRHGNVVVKFYRPGCKYCTHIEPIFETVKKKFADDVTFVNVNLNAQSVEYKKIYKFDYLPTLIYFKDGKEVLRHDSNDGSITASEIERNVLNLIDDNYVADCKKAGTAKQTQSAKPAQPSTKLNAEERACLSLLISLAESHAIKLSELLHGFFDTKSNTEPYKKHVDKFYDLLMSIDNAIVNPLKNAIKNTQKAEYKKLLQLVEKLVSELHFNLKEAHKLLDNHIGKKALDLAKALGDFKTAVEKRAPGIEAALKEMFILLQSLDQELAGKIENMQKTLPESFEMEHNNLVLMNRLNQRMRF